MPSKITVPEIRARKATRGQGEKLAMVTAYDATFARMLDAAGVDAMLVGDSLGMVIQGGTSTLPVTVEEICYHGRAVMRGVQRAHVIGDMPFMSYQASTEQALMNAGRMMKEGGFESVKLEGGKEIAEVIHRLVRMGIPVVAHVGLMPQRVHTMGGFKVQGRNAVDAEAVLEDAIAVVDAGAFALVVEGVPAPLAERITHAVDVPTIGIGAGASCDGQILVSYDLLGLNDTLKPRFVKRYEQFFRKGVEAAKAYVEEVRDGVFPDVEHSFGLKGEPRPARVSARFPTLEAMTLAEPHHSPEEDQSYPALDATPVYGPTQ